MDTWRRIDKSDENADEERLFTVAAHDEQYEAPTSFTSNQRYQAKNNTGLQRVMKGHEECYHVDIGIRICEHSGTGDRRPWRKIEIFSSW